MPRRREVSVTGDVGLVVVWPAEGQLAGSHDTPVRARAAVARQSREVRCGVGVLPEGLEADGVIPKARVPALDLHLVDRPRSAPRRPRLEWSSCWHLAWCPPSEGEG